MTFEALLAKYQQIEVITGQMLVMAQENEWENLLYLQTEYDSIVLFLNELEISNMLDELNSNQQSILESKITEILDNQNQLQKLVDSQRVEVAELIGKKVNLRAQLNSYNNIDKLV